MNMIRTFVTAVTVLFFLNPSDDTAQAFPYKPPSEQCRELGLTGEAEALCGWYCERLDCPDTFDNYPHSCGLLGDLLEQSASDQGVTLYIQDNIVQCRSLPPFPVNDSSQWVCPETLIPSNPVDIEQWCNEHPDRGIPLPDHLKKPKPITDLEAKNLYDLQMDEFLKTEAYKRKTGPGALGWFGDTEWRFTGPVVGNFTEQQNPSSFATHIPVKVWYSPEMIDWFCAGG